MTVAADGRRAIACGALLAIAAITTGACTAPPAGPIAAVAPEVPAADRDAIRTTVDLFNQTAAGPVAAQQARLKTLVDPGSTAALEKCPAATGTLRFEPVYPALRAAPDWAPSDGRLNGTVYALPSLIRKFTGDRVTGTDLTTLHLAVRNGEALLTVICVS